MEETAVAVEALCAVLDFDLNFRSALEPVIRQGTNWLINQIETGGWRKATPIGFYFARLWYFEELYPVAFTVAALGRTTRVLEG